MDNKMEDIIYEEERQVPLVIEKEDPNEFPKVINIYQHMKLNVKHSNQNCKCGSAQLFYCIPCKITVCALCGYEEHKKHIIVNKADFSLSKEKIDDFFKPGDLFFNNASSYKKDLLEKLDTFISTIHQHLDKFKKERVDLIETMFKELESNTKVIKDRLSAVRNKMIDFAERNKKFFNIEIIGKQESNAKSDHVFNLDEDNTYFLTNYDMIGLCHYHSKEIAQINDSIQENMKAYQDIEYSSYNDMEKAVSLFVNKKSLMNNKTDDSNNNNDLKTHQSPSSDKCKGVISANIDNPYAHFISSCKTLGKYQFDDILSRLEKYNKQIEHFKKGIYNTYKKFGSFKEIERSVFAFEKNKQKGADGLFSQRKVQSQRSTKDSDRYQPITPLKSRDDVCLNNPLVEKYYSYLTMDLYGTHFKTESKELQSSHADLMIKLNDNEEDLDYCKVVEGSNELMIYEKKTQKVIKKSLKLNKNPHGYSKFPFGCRALLLGDKIYITGGKDEAKEYNTVLMYDRKTEVLKRIMDLRKPRAYHSMVFNDVFDSLMVFGGENESSVEIFDPLTNRWQMLPGMNIPRANVVFYFDRPRGIMYTMFGVEGNIIDNHYSEIIEFIDLTEVKKGWMILDYKNRSMVDLKNLISIFPLNNDILLVYGGVGNRNSKKIGCILDLPKCEVYSLNQKLLEEIKAEAKNNSKLHSIVSTISLNK